MIENLANQTLAIEPKAARSLMASLTLASKGKFNLNDSNGELVDSDKPRIVQSQSAFHASSDEYKSKPFELVNGIAIIPISGALMHRLGYAGRYWTGYDAIINLFDSANSDPDVKGILLHVNSPGGTVAGCFDACDHIYESKGAKPVWSLYDDMACSAAICIASAADKRLTTQTAISGSIGVVQIHVSYEEMLTDEGVNVTLIYSGEHKVDGNPYKNLPEDVYKNFKVECDQLRQKFIDKVSRNIGLSNEQVLETEAITFTGQDAVNAGLADELINSHNIINHFQQYLSGEDSTTNRSVTMSGQETAAVVDSVNAEADTAKDQPDAASEQQAVETDQQARCESIITCEEAQGNTALANHLAFKTNLSVEDAKAALEASGPIISVNGANPLIAAMATVDQPEIGAVGDDQEQSEASQYVASYKSVVGE